MTNGRRAALQTYHAIQASDLASAFNDALKKMRLEPGDYGVELTAPEGPSTAGGVQALQHVRLVPSRPGFSTLVIGHANHADGKAELRTYDYLDATHRQRFRRPLALDRGQYDQVLGLAKQMLEVLRLATVVAGPPQEIEEDLAVAVESRRLSPWVVVGVVGVFVVLFGLGLWLLFGASRLS
jgi:hypothetical protein